MAKFCTSCGNRLEDAARFCGACGTPCAPVATPVQPPVPQPMQQPMQPPPMQLTPKQQILQEAPYALNRPDIPWQVTVEGDSIVARWKWMDATFFAPHEVTRETRDYSFAVTLSDNRTWKELDRSGDKKAGVGMSGGKLSLGGSSNTFIGKQNTKSFQLGVGLNNQTGQAGIVAFKFDTTPVKDAVRGYLASRGWKKAG